MGLLGAGGALLTVPAMIYLLHQPIAAATTTSLVVVAACAAVGATVNVRRGAVDLRLAGGFAAAGIGGAFLGSWLSRFASGLVDPLPARPAHARRRRGALARPPAGGGAAAGRPARPSSWPPASASAC